MGQYCSNQGSFPIGHLKSEWDIVPMAQSFQISWRAKLRWCIYVVKPRFLFKTVDIWYYINAYR